MPNCFTLLCKRQKAKTTPLRGMAEDGPINAPVPSEETTGTDVALSARPDSRADVSSESIEGASAPVPPESPGRTGWLVLKEVLTIVREGSDLFPPLKAALVGVVAVMDKVDDVRDVRDDFEDIAQKIDGFQAIFYHELGDTIYKCRVS
ncbi:hypothetical protein OBBRIDRAFT_654176 [Obba rivulosa]|uniref:Uncharacterized protein n=1 Tax=Obba rivulosa TaxID=1052685 RepID=A0A8E2AUV2_9APHY|nr:hypothetical protein OBBRIDRAFT_654176 [Obba rivulosa]